jgi:hypothetical protein
MNKQLTDILRRVENWPEPAQEELVRAALEIEAEQGAAYQASPAELEAINEALGQLGRGEIASSEEVEAAFSAFRRG